MNGQKNVAYIHMEISSPLKKVKFQVNRQTDGAVKIIFTEVAQAKKDRHHILLHI